MDQQKTSASDQLIDVHAMFELVCWAKHFGVAQSRIKEAVARVGNEVPKVSAYLQAA